MADIYYSPAKLNLFLEVLGKREDGFHDIETLFCRISLYDILEISIKKNARFSISVDMQGFALPQEDNICYKAAKLFFERANINDVSVEIKISKNIPMQAGLGGGSSNAAVVLMALNKELPVFSEQELLDMGAQLGSDVPFFLLDCTLAIGRGRGEILEKADIDFSMPFFIVCPPISLSTKEIYSSLKLTNQRRDVNIFLAALKQGGELEFYNRLYEPAIEYDNRLREEMDIAESIFASKAYLTGSGSAFFFPYKEYGESVLRRLAKKAGRRGWKGFAVEPV